MRLSHSYYMYPDSLPPPRSVGTEGGMDGRREIDSHNFHTNAARRLKLKADKREAKARRAND